ncbi:hypothetical protein C3L33_04545, partial [Rhododendron williamsianum]
MRTLGRPNSEFSETGKTKGELAVGIDSWSDFFFFYEGFFQGFTVLIEEIDEGRGKAGLDHQGCRACGASGCGLITVWRFGAWERHRLLSSSSPAFPTRWGACGGGGVVGGQWCSGGGGGVAAVWVVCDDGVTRSGFFSSNSRAASSDSSGEGFVGLATPHFQGRRHSVVVSDVLLDLECAIIIVYAPNEAPGRYELRNVSLQLKRVSQIPWKARCSTVERSMKDIYFKEYTNQLVVKEFPMMGRQFSGQCYS